MNIILMNKCCIQMFLNEFPATKMFYWSLRSTTVQNTKQHIQKPIFDFLGRHMYTVYSVVKFKSNKSLSETINSSMVLDVIIQHCVVSNILICGAKSYSDDARTTTNNFNTTALTQTASLCSMRVPFPRSRLVVCRPTWTLYYYSTTT